MQSTIRVIYDVSDDVHWTPVEVDELVLAPDLIMEITDDEPNIFVLDYPINKDQTSIHIDRATCKRFHAEFLPVGKLLKGEIDIDWLRKATFLQVVKVFAEVPGYEY
ncbi:hypothetical protein BABA_17447 [Neobacillus bataviensis LMG 21833]|uniref:Uncharacterized protein n=1 Tax=Neobacillus bataviensis LMG 21833 TaxID=1117379 RepID=K6DYW3_9BACI|nr:hypothetical protein [Neobacillus bataviensis]EKN66051.1 hypothetical protein BABA_17447 [Neobacillus bataviensis LMG 21833]